MRPYHPFCGPFQMCDDASAFVLWTAWSAPCTVANGAVPTIWLLGQKSTSASVLGLSWRAAQKQRLLSKASIDQPQSAQSGDRPHQGRITTEDQLSDKALNHTDAAAAAIENDPRTLAQYFARFREPVIGAALLRS